FDRRLIMIVGDLGSAGGLLIILLVMLFGELELWHIYMGVTISAVFAALQSPAYKASATDLLTTEQYSKGSGLVQLAESSKFLFSPIIAGVLLSVTSIEWILVINILTYLLAVFAVFVIRKRLKSDQSEEKRKHWLSDLSEGWHVIRNNRGV